MGTGGYGGERDRTDRGRGEENAEANGEQGLLHEEILLL